MYISPDIVFSLFIFLFDLLTTDSGRLGVVATDLSKKELHNFSKWTSKVFFFLL